MYNANIPSNEDLPSTAKLIKSTLLAFIGAAVLLVTVVMPAEYGMDPTGIGKAIGLKAMGDIKHELAHEAEADAKAHAASIQEDSHDHHGSNVHSHDDDHQHQDDKEHTHDDHSHEPKGHHHGDGNYHQH